MAKALYKTQGDQALGKLKYIHKSDQLSSIHPTADATQISFPLGVSIKEEKVEQRK